MTGAPWAAGVSAHHRHWRRILLSTTGAVVAVAGLAITACSPGGSSAAPTTTTEAPPGTSAPGTSATVTTATTRTTTSVGTTSCAGPLEGPATRQYRTDVGDADADLVSLDVYRRAGATGCPVLIWVHGGGWHAGDKAGRAIDRKVRFAGELGAVLVSVNYRLAAPDNDVRWPVMGEDVAAAVAWVLDHADEFGIDPDRVALMGHSAGAHLVTIVATEPELRAAAGATGADIDCVVALDSAAYRITLDQVRASGLAAMVFGDDPASLAAASPTVQAAAHPDDLPDVLVVTRGSRARVAEAQEFAATVRASGAAATVVEADGLTHDEVNTRLGAPGDEVVTPPVRDFLGSCLG